MKTRSRKMKKIVLILISILVVMASSLALAGCSKTEQATPTSPSPTSPASPSAAASTGGAQTSVAAASSALKPQDGGVLRIIGTEGPQGSIGIPEKMRGMASGQVGPTIEPLLTLSASGKLTPLLVESLDWSNSNKTITLHLRKGVKFHDGTDFNSQALKWNFEQRMAVKADGTDVIESMQAIDDYTYQVNLIKYQNTWLGKLGGTLGMQISPTAVQKNGADSVNWRPVGTGPFKFVDYKENDHWEMARFEGYWGGKSHLDGIRYIFIADPVTAQIAFQAKEGDVISVTSGAAKLANDLKSKGFNVDTTAGLCFALIPSVATPSSPISNVKVRQAIEYALDKVKIAKTIGLGYYDPLYQYAGSTQAPFDPNFEGRRYDPAKARQLLAEAGFPSGFKTVLIEAQQSAGDEAALMQANLKDVGIDAEIQIVAASKWIELETNGWPEGIEMSVTTMITDYGTTIMRYIMKPAQPNWARGLYWNSFYRPDELENLVQQYLVIPDTAGQTAKGREIIKSVFDNCCAIPLFETKSIAVVQPTVHDRLTGDLVPARSWNFLGTWLSK
jgi:peptide/nickel transport system substrate-binding protein